MSRRNRHLNRIRAILVFTAVASVGIRAASTWMDDRSPEFRRGFTLGRAEAETQFAQGDVTLYTFGLRDDSNIDGETGLPLQPIAGCVVDDSVIGRAEGHNQRVRELLDAGKPAANSRKTWIDDLNDLARYYTLGADAKHRKPVRLTVGGPCAVSPDGKRRVRLESPPPTLPECARLVLVQPDAGVKYADGLVRGNEAELRWGPDGSNFCVIRHGRDAAYDAVDLSTAQVLRTTTRVRPSGNTACP